MRTEFLGLLRYPFFPMSREYLVSLALVGVGLCVFRHILRSEIRHERMLWGNYQDETIKALMSEDRTCR